MNSQPDLRKHRQQVRQAFDRAAHTYDGAAEVQREICESLLELSREFSPQYPIKRLLDAGSGTGFALPALTHSHSPAQLIALDFAPAMLHHTPAEAHRLCADIEAMPLPNACVDAIFSSLALQWCQPHAALQSFARVLKKDGKCWLATLGPDTLHELRRSFSYIGSDERVMHFESGNTWRSAAFEAGLKVHSLQRRAYHVRAHDLRGIIKHIKSIGAHRPDTTRRPPITRHQWRQLEQHYEAFRHEGTLRATYDVFLMVLSHR